MYILHWTIHIYGELSFSERGDKFTLNTNKSPLTVNTW